nr:nonribosomal peptide synthetase [Cloning vector H69C977B_s26]
MTSEESIEDIYELAPMQHGMLFHALMEPGAGMYVEQLSCEVRGDLPINRWKEAWQHVLARHPILRSGFLWEGLEKPLQVVAVEAEVPWRIEDIRHVPEDAQQRWIDDFLREDRLQGFDLGTPPLIRCALIRLDDARHLFVWTYHHLLLDGWCFSIVLREVLGAFEEGVAALPPAARPYRDYIAWLQEQDPSRAESFWRERLQGFKQPTPLPFTERQDTSEPAGDTQPEVTKRLSPELTARLTGFAKAHRLTLNTLVQGAWALVLARATGTDDVIFGVTVSGRPADLAGSESIVGLFINTLPLRARLDGTAPVATFLSGLQTEQGAVEPYSYASLADIQHWSDAPKDRPLFESILVFENYPLDASTLLPRSGLTISSVNTHDRISYPLALVAIPGESLELRVMYAADAFSRPMAERIARLLEAALESLPGAKTVGDIDLMDEAARRVLAEWGQHPRAYDVTRPVTALLDGAAPDATAVVGPDGQSISYRELDRRAERVARHLRQLGAGRERIVGVCIGRSVEMVVALLGVLKAGAAYLPLDPNYPAERLAYIVGDAAPVAILNTGADPIADTRVPRLDVSRVLNETATPDVPAKEPVQLDDLAYVIYTSGSTGAPKGVLVTHRNLMNLVSWHTEAFGLTAKDRTTQLASTAFDASVWEIWPTLAAGATLHLVPPELSSAPSDLANWLVAQQISISFLPTVVAEAVLALQWPSPCALRFVLTGGDRLHATPPAGLPFQLVNNYGPTETTVVATSGTVAPDGKQGLPSIGRPVANARIYILDRQRRPVLPGVIGELYIGGVGVTRGYLNRPDLNVERFVPDPFAGVPEARMYASGDFARFLPDGTIAFHGRADRQVQIRGVRVELGEIEAALAAHPDVTAAAVVSEAQRQNGDVRLIAFAVSDVVPQPDAAVLTQFLATKLPTAILPSRVIVIDRLPLTPNGKVDTAALEARALEAQPQVASAAPRTPHEEILAGIWSAVLGQERVGIHDDFFDLGGHSLKATQVIARTREAFGVDIPVRAIFERRTIAQLAETLSGQGTAVEPIPHVELTGDTPVAPGQESLWFIDALGGDSAAYNVPLVLRLQGTLDGSALARTLQLLVERHEALRSTFHDRGGTPVLRVQAPAASVLVSEDVSPALLDARIAEEVAAPFSLTDGPLFRARHFRLAPDNHVLVLNQHHIIADAWSVGVLLREFCIVYASLVSGTEPALPALPIRYADWAAWQRQRLESGRLDESVAFWREALKDAPPVLPLPTDHPRPERQRFHGKTHGFVLDAPLGQRLEALSRSSGASLFMTLLGAFAAYLGRISGQEDVVIGSPVANRDRHETEGVVGYFLNTLALRVDLSGDPTFSELLLRVRKTALDAYAHQDVPFEKLVAALELPRGLAHNPLFQVMFVLQGQSGGELQLPDVRAEIQAPASSTSKFDLTFFVEPREGALACSIEYDTDLFDADRIDRMAAHLGRLLQAIAEEPELHTSELPLLSNEERRLYADLNRTERRYTGRTLPELFERQAQRTPDATAVVGPDGQSISYRELDRRAERVARHLRQLGAGRERIVGVCIGRSVEMVVALLGVLKAGAAYLPLDPNYPAERLAYIVGDAAPVAILNTGADPIADTRVPRLDVSRVLNETATPDVPAKEPVQLDDLAYVIYTSGSTGAPKGVLVTHRNLMNLVSWHTEAFGLTAKDRTTQLASTAFDASVWEIWPTLAAGATLHLVPPELSSAPSDLANWLVAQQISISFLPTVVAEAVLALQWPSPCALRFVLTGGDRLHATPPAGLPFQLVNNYGPTETTVVATSGTVAPDGKQGLPSIGRPVANARIYILDRQRRPVLPGVIGELYIGGVGVTRGYLNRPDLNVERFVPDPFAGVPEARMYASGDFARFLPDGTIAFHGRADRQVQIRGVRVELGEIEAALAAHPDVTAAAVVSEAQRQNGDVRLIAFAVSDVVPQPDAAVLTQFLATKLPTAILPSRVIVIDRLPLTPNGKVDTAALEARALEAQPQVASAAPRTPHEEILAGIWSAVLGQERVGIHDDFFDLGGHSLKATQVIARTREAFGVDIPVRAIFERRTIAQLAETLSGQGTAVEPIPHVELTGDTPVAPGQESLWFIDALGGDSAAYNVPLVLRLQGTLDGSALARTLQLLVERHEALRSTFHDRGGTPVLRVQAPAASVLVSEDVSPALLDARIAEEVAAPFSLTDGPLFRARHFRLAPDNHVLVLNQHHIIADAWSVGVLLREFCIVYASLVSGTEPALPALPIRYADWAAWQRQRLESGRLDESVAFWREALKDAPPVLPLPTDHPRPERQRFHGKTHGFVLDAPLGQRLEALSRSSGASLFMTLLGAFAAYLGRISGQEDVVIGSPVANRDRHETEGVVGYFLNTLALRVDLSGDPTFSELLLRVRKTALDAYAHQDVPFEKLVAALELPRGLAHNPLFQVMFVLQGQSGGELQLPDVRAEIQAPASSTSKFDLTFFVEPREGALACSIEYDTDLFDADRIDRMAAHLGRLLQAIAEEPELHTSELPLLSNEERRLYADLNRTERRYTGRTLPELFERQAQRTPDVVALEHQGETRTYRQLHEAAEALADRLGALGVGPGVRVSICLDRSIHAQVALLAVLKAGGAYVPLDPTYPPERLRYMLEDARPRVLLTEKKYSELLPSQGLTQVLLDDTEAPATKTPRPRVEPHHLAYVLYTSGSTGKPKGVAMPHRALVNLIEWQTEHASPLRTLQFAPLNFDVSFQETFSTWCSGGTLVLIDEGTRRDPDALADFLDVARVQRLFLPAVALHHLAQAALRTEHRVPGLTEVITAGDQLRITDPIRRWFQEGGKRLHNHYGPTESHVVTALELEGDPRHWPGLPSIGRPIANAAVHLLDANQRPVPVGVPGELYLAGTCLADGYLSRPDLTAERFVELPLSPPVRAYRTGDLGRLTVDGSIEFLGRADDQVKIRGFRVEPGEIERALCAHPDVRDAAVIVDGDATREKRLVAYVVPETVRLAELPDFLARDLPEYMVPALFVPMPELPRTPSGKVARRALPAPVAPVQAESPSEPPRTPTEATVARAFEQVLGRGVVGREQDFFQLGGHSLLAMQVVSRIRGDVDAAFRVSDLFENPTIASLSRVLDARRGSQTLTLARIEPAPEGAAIPLSFSQERLWFLDQLYPGTTAYNLPMALRLTGTLDVSAFQESLSDIVRRHPVLGMRFVERDGRVWQEPRANQDVPFEQVTLGETSPEALRLLIAEEAARPFDLTNGPLFRAKLFCLDEAAHVVVATMHHTVGDGWSISVLVRELSQLYAGRVSGQPVTLPELPVDYRDFAYQQRRHLQGEVLEQRLDHWRKTLHGAPSALDLPMDRPRPPRTSMRGATERIALGKALSEAIEALSLRTGGTSFMVLMGGFAAYLARITGQDDIVIGTPVANRDRAELESLIGFFVGTLPLRIDLSANPTFEELVARVRASALDAYAYQDVPLEKIVEALGVERNLSHAPLFQVMLMLQNTPEGHLSLPGLALEPIDLEIESAKFDLTLSFEPTREGLAGVIEYSTDLFDADRIERMVAHLQVLFADAVAHPEKRLSELALLPEQERGVVAAFTQGRLVAPTRHVPAHRFVEEHAERTPDAIALELGQERLTYGELNRRANRAAHQLIAMGAGPEMLVALAVPRSFEMLIGLLAIWKAGAAYVPLDLSYPKDRLDGILEDSGAALMVSTHAAEQKWRAPQVRTLWLDEPADAAPTGNPDSGVRMENAAYVIYTSGSTGRPKGVILEHRGLANVIEMQRHELGADAGCVMLQFSSISFDVSVWEIVMALTNGGRLVVAPADTLLAGDELAKVLLAHGVTHMVLPPTSYAALPTDREYPALRMLTSAGEALPPEVVHTWARPGVLFVNAYGPTEVSIISTLGHCRQDDPGAPPIGRPALNLEGYALDRHGALLPIGVPGELHIGGVGVARGYLNREELTREKFIPHPFKPDARLYRSGDLVRWRKDGNLEYLGRIDHQVKLRGYRIELGEIEAVLASYPGVAKAVANVHSAGAQGGVKALIAYVVSTQPVDVHALREYARKKLPEFMVPAQFIHLEELPLSSSGKVDKRRLPPPRFEASASETRFVPPRTPTEQTLASLWESLLERRPIGAEDNFFDLGGHSLLAAQVMSRVRRTFGVDVPLSAIFEQPTLTALAAVIAAKEAAPQLPPLVRLTSPGDRPLSFAQERLRFLAELEGQSAAYNIPFAFTLRGSLDEAALRRSLQRVLERHEVLRTNFPLVDGLPVARVADAVLTLTTEDLRHAGAVSLDQRLAEESARPFALDVGPVVRVHLFKRADDEHVLLVAMHHIVSDGWSFGVMMREFSAFYAAEVRGEPLALPDLPIQYTDYAAWQRSWLDGQAREHQLGHWRKALAGAPAVLDLPTDRPRPAVRSHRGATEPLALAPDVAQALTSLCREQGVTAYMALLAAFGAYLGRVSGQDDVVIGSPFAGRRIAETEPLIGFFVNSLPLRIDLGGEPTFLELLQRVRRQVLDAHEHQDVPFEKLVEVLKPERVLGTSPLFQVMLAYQQTHTAKMALPGLEVTPVAIPSGAAKFDLTLTLSETAQGFEGVLEYDRDLFDAWRIQAMVRQLTGFITRLAAEPRSKVVDVDLLGAEERARLTPRAPEAAPSLPAVHEVIAAQAAKTPTAIAVEAEDGTLTYAALEARAKAVAQALVQRGVTPGTLVALAVERSVGMMAGLLGILKAGAAYVPLDPAYPRERLTFMLEDSGARVVITQAHLTSRFPGTDVVVLGDDTLESFEPRSGALAYCLFTSGSTGQPKGVLIEHSALANHMAWMDDAMPLAHEDRVLQRTSLSFDASVWELFAPLMVGARLVLAPHGLGADTEHLARVLRERDVSVLQLVPSLLTALVEEPGFANLPALRRVCVGGEPLPSATVATLFSRSKAEVWNLYGPTEATIDSLAHRCLPGQVGAHGPTEPIGLPIHRMEALILDGRLRPVPEGVPGELYLAGPGLARGYLNRPELTQSRFIEHAFPGGPTLRMYKTGDVVRRLADGTFLFVGRADRQVKLRGHRIELGEVEAAIARHPAVREAVALVRGTGGDSRLVAFVVPHASAQRPEPTELRSFVEQQLTANMVPGQFVLLDALPLAPNGKVDTRALSAMELADARVTALEGLPRDALELEMVRLFEEVLGVRAVGIHDSFFDLGGHSLLALKMKLAVEKRLGRPLPLVSLFRNPTPAQLTAVLRTENAAVSPLVPLTPEAHALMAAGAANPNRTPVLYLVPGGGSTPFYLLSLARHLEGVAVFGLQPQGLDGDVPPHETVEAIATWYADAILAMQPEGPYSVGGHSMGGHIAYELAQELKARGREVGVVAMLDTLAPFPDVTRPQGEGWDTAQWMLHLAGIMEAFFNVKIDLALPEVRAMGEAERLQFFVARLQAAAVLPEGAQPVHVQGILNVARAHDALNYRPRRGQPVPLAVFRAEDRCGPSTAALDALVQDGTLGWSQLTQQACSAYPVPGTHLSLLRDPHAAVLAQHLLALIPRPTPTP